MKFIIINNKVNSLSDLDIENWILKKSACLGA